MAYKRYIKRGGKVYGPYIYHSRKKDGKVISEYRGKAKENKINVKLLYFSLFLFFIFVVFALFQIRFTGDVIFEKNILSENRLKVIENSVSVVESKISTDIESGVIANVTKIQYGAVLGRPVKWTKRIELSEAANLSVEIPLIAENISILEIVRLSEVFDDNGTTESEINETAGEEINETIEETINQTQDI